jgi:hypothetical protein
MIAQGFGFMDNLVMIQAGDLIDSTIGVRFGLSTLTAAAFGQVFSDVSGVCFGGTVEAIASRLGLPVVTLTMAQLSLPIAKRTALGGAVVGVIVGCLLGMTSLLFMDLGKAERLKREKELDTIFSTIMDAKLCKLLNADRCSLFIVDKPAGQMWTRVALGVKEIISIPLHSGLAGEAAKLEGVLNIRDCYGHPKFDRSTDKITGFRTQSMIACPVRNSEGEVVAVVEAMTGGAPSVAGVQVGPGFTAREEDLLQMLASHISIFMDHLDGES